MTYSIRLIILGEPCSKANSRQIVKIGDLPKSIKSKKALAYERDALMQIPVAARQQLTGPVRVRMMLYYASERPDLDESIVLDVLQDRYVTKKVLGTSLKVRTLVQKGVYLNDRQVRWKEVRHAIDRRNPRAEIQVDALQPQQVRLPDQARQAMERSL